MEAGGARQQTWSTQTLNSKSQTQAYILPIGTSLCSLLPIRGPAVFRQISALLGPVISSNYRSPPNCLWQHVAVDSATSPTNSAPPHLFILHSFMFRALSISLHFGDCTSTCNTMHVRPSSLILLHACHSRTH